MYSKEKMNFKIFVSTWNVGFSEPPVDLTSYWLKNINQYDILAIGFQECKVFY